MNIPLPRWMSGKKSAPAPAAPTPERIRGLYYRADRKLWMFSRMRDGVRETENLHTGDYAEAVAKVAAMQSAGTLCAAGGIGAEAEAYIAAKLAAQTFRPATARGVRGHLDLFVEHFGPATPLSAFDADTAKAYYEYLLSTRKAITANTYFVAVRGMFAHLAETRKIRSNPFAVVKLAVVHELAKLRWLPMADADRLIAEAPTDALRFILYCGFHAGMRKNEIVSAHAGWFDLERQVLTIRNEDRTLRDDAGTFVATFKQKDGARLRTVPLSDAFAAFLRGWPHSGAYCLAPHKVRQGKWRYRYDFNRPFTEYMRAQGKPWVSVHVMRHSFASFHVSLGQDIFRVAAWLGDDVETTHRHYAHLAPDDRALQRAHDVAARKDGSLLTLNIKKE